MIFFLKLMVNIAPHQHKNEFDTKNMGDKLTTLKVERQI
jgi:hypothetical protein